MCGMPSSSSKFWVGTLEHIRELVLSDNIGLALEQLVHVLKAAESRDLNTAILLASRLAHLQREERAGLLSPGEAIAQSNGLRLAILEVADEALRRLAAERRPIGSIAVHFDAPENNNLEKIFGANHLRSVAWLARALRASKSVCRIVTPRGLGSGFLVNSRCVLTNWHVIPDGRIAGSSAVEFNYEEDEHGQLAPVSRFHVTDRCLFTDVELDVSLVEIDVPKGSASACEFVVAGVARNPTIHVGDHVVIVQHPQGGPKQIALTANQVVNIFGPRLQYTTDTLPGSSGSPVFNDDWKVIAIHHAGGNLVCNDRGERMFANEGILLTAVLARLKAGGIELPLPNA